MPSRATRWLSDQPHLLLTLTMLIWGSNVVAGKLAVGHISPMVLTFCRWAIAIVVFGYLARKHLAADRKLIRANAGYLLVMGAAGFAVFNIFYYSALQFTSAVNVVIEQAAIPLVIFVANLVIFRVRTHWLQVAGFGLALVGVLLTISGGDLSALAGLELNRGDALMVVALLCYGLFTVALRAKPEMHWMSFFTCLVGGAFIASAPAAVWETVRGDAIWPVTSQGLLVALYAAVLPSIVAQLFYIRGTEKLGANAAGMYIMLVPFFGVALAVLLLGERFGLHHALALVLVTGGIFVAQRANPQPAKKIGS